MKIPSHKIGSHHSKDPQTVFSTLPMTLWGLGWSGRSSSHCWKEPGSPRTWDQPTSTDRRSSETHNTHNTHNRGAPRRGCPEGDHRTAAPPTVLLPASWDHLPHNPLSSKLCLSPLLSVTHPTKEACEGAGEVGDRRQRPWKNLRGEPWPTILQAPRWGHPSSLHLSTTQRQAAVASPCL